MKRLAIKWHRLISDGKTCPRCGATEDAVDKAAATLRQSLATLGIEVVLEKTELSVAQFRQNPLQSNAISIGGRPLEDWLGAKTGQSVCCEVCGPNDCRTVTLGGEVYEAIPAELVVRAGLLAAAELLGRKGCGCEPAAPAPGGGCCSQS